MTRQRQSDALANWFFRAFLRILQSDRVRIARKKRLTNPDDSTRRAIRGLMDPDVHPSGRWVHILINPAKNTHRNRDDEVNTLVHELAHTMFPNANERQILSIENLLAARLTRTQRTSLRAFIPRHEVKRYPSVPHSATMGA